MKDRKGSIEKGMCVGEKKKEKKENSNYKEIRGSLMLEVKLKLQ